MFIANLYLIVLLEEIGKQQKKKVGQPRKGIARCTFDDRIKKSDIVFFQAALPFVSKV